MSERESLLPHGRIHFQDGAPYPLLVFRTRYGGVYEGGTWAAVTSNQIPEDADGDDVSCCSFWGEIRESQGITADRWRLPIALGVGESPEGAIAAATDAARLHNTRAADSDV